jgi:tetratricopeptide (TPR) repeat protein
MRGIFVGWILVLVALPAWAQSRDEIWAQCEGKAPNTSNSDGIHACTALILSGKEDIASLTAAYNNRAVYYFRSGLTDDSIADLTKAIEIKPDEAQSYHSRAFAYLKKGLYDRVIADETKVIGLVPDSAGQAYYQRGVAYEKKGQRAQAIADYRAALKLNTSDDDSKQALTRLGVTP